MPDKNNSNEIVPHEDENVIALKQKANTLENSLNNLANEKAELEKIITEFQRQHTLELGNLILEILQRRKIIFQNDPLRSTEAEKDYRDYYQQFTETNNEKNIELSEVEKKELRSKYRKATNYCHPDKVSPNFKDEASKIFNELNKAYKQNDLERLSQILNQLEKGNYFISESESQSDSKKLNLLIDELIQKVKQTENEIADLKNSHSYKIIITVESLSDYFEQMKKNLQKEIAELKTQ